MYRADSHTHTQQSLDSQAPMEEQVKRAIALGFDELVITDHHESDVKSTNYFLQTDIDDYIHHFNNVESKYKAQINLKLGAEIGYEARGKDVLAKFVQDNPFEFIICSIHSLQGEDLYFGDFFKNKTKKQAYIDYFKAVLACVQEFNEFDVFGHLDFICRYGDYENKDLDYLDYKELIDEILKTLINKSKGIEINTSGIRYKVGHMHPRLDIIKSYKQLGGQIITIGSDAHRPQDIGHGYEEARALLKQAGFEYFTTFNRRVPEFRKL